MTTPTRDLTVCHLCKTTEDLIFIERSCVDHKPITVCRSCQANAVAMVRAIPIVLREKAAALVAGQGTAS